MMDAQGNPSLLPVCSCWHPLVKAREWPGSASALCASVLPGQGWLVSLGPNIGHVFEGGSIERGSGRNQNKAKFSVFDS